MLSLILRRDERSGQDPGRLEMLDTPVVRVNAKGANTRWKEAQLRVAQVHGSTPPVYAATFDGGVAVAGRQRLAGAIGADMGTNTQVDPLGDGAVWIADQVAALWLPGSLYGELFPCLRLSRGGGAAPPTTLRRGWKPRRRPRKAIK
jgi:hypothetical protein